jgi:hypothetical protein
MNVVVSFCMSGSGAEVVDARLLATFERKNVAKSLAENLSVVKWFRGGRSSLTVLHRPYATLR